MDYLLIIVKKKPIYYNSFSGKFLTCEYCWKNSDLNQLKLIYTKDYYKNENLYQSGYYTNNKLDFLLSCVEKEYYKDLNLERNKKIKRLIKKLKNK